MKRILSSYYTKLLVICQVLMLFCLSLTPVFTTNVSAANTSNFYFEDATFDYYLEKADDGTSKLHVEETLTAVFPDSNQNHGITRSIPYTNQNGKNKTADSINALNLRVTRNGQSEEIAKTETENGNYIFYFGNKNTYVHGRQVYVLSYDFKNVITEFNDAGNLTHDGISALFQELYWDTNGTGWAQQFQNLTANLHISSQIANNVIAGKTSCYVGSYGSSSSSRCYISDNGDTITFKTSNLKAYENLTFAVDFKPDTFTVPEPPKSYALVIATVVIAGVCLIIIFFSVRSYYKKAHAKKSYYKSLFTAPQYDTPKDYFIAEASHLYFGKKEKTYTATLLELAISKKISIKKGEPTKVLKKDTWVIKINSTEDISDSQDDLLRILNGGPRVHDGDEIKVKKHTATSTLASLSKSYQSDAEQNLRKLKLLEEGKTASLITFLAIFVIFFIAISLASGIVSFLPDIFGDVSTGVYGYSELVGSNILPIVIVAIIIATIIASSYFNSQTNKYKAYTNAGLDAANYLDGLYLYINMAEKDRLKFLQSVKGADTTKEGIVHLYEKLLPYACLFGVEESWAKELGRYCKEINYNPDWYPDGDLATFYAISSITSSINTTVSASTSYTSSSSSSSGSSGGGGGGFSGGGGGGGGGGGW